MPEDIVLRYVPGRGWLPIGVRGNVATHSISGNFTEHYRGEFRATAQDALEHALRHCTPEA